MNYSDYIKMTQVGVYSITFPTDNLVETLGMQNSITCAKFDNLCKERFEIVKNLLTGKKVMELENGGLFFSIRAEFKHITKELISHKVSELQNEYGFADDKTAKFQAECRLYELLPLSSELYNIFYNPNTQILMINSNSKRSKAALSELVEVFGLVGVKSVIISNQKLGLNAKFANFLNDGTPLFKSLGFDHEATLRRETDDDKTFRTCRHLDMDEGKANAVQALKDGFAVQSLAMRCGIEDGAFNLRFKLDENLRLRSMKFAQYAETARELRSNEAGKSLVLMKYLEDQYEVLNCIIKNTLLEFTQETKLEDFA